MAFQEIFLNPVSNYSLIVNPLYTKWKTTQSHETLLLCQTPLCILLYIFWPRFLFCSIIVVVSTGSEINLFMWVNSFPVSEVTFINVALSYWVYFANKSHGMECSTKKWTKDLSGALETCDNWSKKSWGGHFKWRVYLNMKLDFELIKRSCCFIKKHPVRCGLDFRRLNFDFLRWR